MTAKNLLPEYLGDGVYATTDGYYIWLRLGHHEAEPLVALEREVLISLVNYAKRIGLWKGEEIVKTNWRELLKSYMIMVNAEEGTVFLNSSFLTKSQREDLSVLEAELDL